MNKNKIKNILICAGGTAGHIFPAVELSKKFSNEGYSVFLAGDRRMYHFVNEKSLLSGTKIKLKCFYGRGFRKKFYFYNLISFLYLILVFLQSMMYFFFNRPSIAIGFGGYITFPVLFSSFIFRAKIYIHEGNIILGKANRILSNISAALMINFDEIKNLPNKKVNFLYVGIPIRQKIINLYNLDYSYKKNTTINLLITGGSLGAEIMSTKIAKAITKLSLNIRSRLSIVQQARKENILELEKLYSKYKLSYRLETFINNISEELSLSDIVICRCGALTLSENLIAGKPAIMIPFANSTENHQYFNAKFIEKRGAGWLITEEQLTDEIYVINKLEFIFTNTKEFFSKSKSAKNLAILNSTDKIMKITLDEKYDNREE